MLVSAVSSAYSSILSSNSAKSQSSLPICFKDDSTADFSALKPSSLPSPSAIAAITASLAFPWRHSLNSSGVVFVVTILAILSNSFLVLSKF